MSDLPVICEGSSRVDDAVCQRAARKCIAVTPRNEVLVEALGVLDRAARGASDTASALVDVVAAVGMVIEIELDEFEK